MKIYSVEGTLLEEGTGIVPCLVNVCAFNKTDARYLAQTRMIERGLKKVNMFGKVTDLGKADGGWGYGNTLWIS